MSFGFGWAGVVDLVHISDNEFDDIFHQRFHTLFRLAAKSPLILGLSFAHE